MLTGGTLDIAKPSKGKEKATPAGDDGEDELEEDVAPVQKRGLPETKKTYSKDKVRMSQNDRTLDSMFPVVHPAAQSSSSSPDKGDNTKYRKGKEKEVVTPTTEVRLVIIVEHAERIKDGMPDLLVPLTRLREIVCLSFLR